MWRFSCYSYHKENKLEEKYRNYHLMCLDFEISVRRKQKLADIFKFLGVLIRF